MEIHNDIEGFGKVKDLILTIGTFDGVHSGHKKIISRLKELKKVIGGETAIFTFDPHPRTVLFPEQTDLKLLTTTPEKTELIREMGIDHLIIFPFTQEFAQISSINYIKDILVGKLGIKQMVIGYDHRFGKNRDGNIEILKKYSKEFHYEVEEIPAKDIDNINISSTHIRKALTAGNINMANDFLGYPYFFSGKVCEGKKLGRTIGYPTANISISDKLKLLPAIGVYAVRVEYEGKPYKGMLSIGTNPTTDTDDKIKIEVNIFDFNEDIYNKYLKISLIERLRNEEKFATLEVLKDQLRLDKELSLKLL